MKTIRSMLKHLFLAVPLMLIVSCNSQPPSTLIPHRCENGKFGYVDEKGKEWIEGKYDYAEEFSEDLAVVQVGKRGIMPEFGKTDCGVRCSSRSSQSGERLKVLFMHIARATVIQRHLCPIIFARRHLHEISIGQRSDFSPTRCIAHIERGVNVYPI